MQEIAIKLVKGIIYKEDDVKMWNGLLEHENALRDYFKVVGVDLIIDKKEGYAYLKQNTQSDLPRIVKSTQLAFYPSFLLVLLRQRLAKDEELVILKEQIYDTFLLFFKIANEERFKKDIEAAIKKVVELGFLKPLGGDTYKIRPSLKAFVDAKWLDGFDKELQEYIAYAKGK